MCLCVCSWTGSDYCEHGMYENERSRVPTGAKVFCMNIEQIVNLVDTREQVHLFFLFDENKSIGCFTSLVRD